MTDRIERDDETGFNRSKGEVMHPLQALVNGMGAHAQTERATSQITLGKLIAALEAVEDQSRPVCGLGSPESYRGYYVDLAFDPHEDDRPVSEVLAAARACMGRVFQGYKGGDYLMGESTPVWSATYGSCGDRLMGLDTSGRVITVETAEEDEEEW